MTEFLLQEDGSFAPASSLENGAAETNTATGSPAGPAQGGAPQQSPYSGLWVLALMFLVVWMFLIRPERKRQRQAQSMRDALKKGDRVVTAGGMHGKVVSLDDGTATLEVAEKVRIQFNRNAVVAVSSPQEKGDEKKEG